MALIRWQPAELTDLRRDFERLFDGYRNPPSPTQSIPQSWSPATDIEETPEAYQVTAELPGVAKEDVQVTLNENRLTIRGEKKQETTQEKQTTHRAERVHGPFSRSFDLPSSVQADKISASYKDGVLRVAVPKAEAAKPKQIEINVN